MHRDTIAKIELSERLATRRAATVEAERAVAIRDLLATNRFVLPGHNTGPYHLRIGIEGQRLAITIRDHARTELAPLALPLGTFRPLIRDYFLICDSFHAAYAQGDRTRLESIDMARRGLHDEGASLLRARLAGQVDIDHPTARGLFTLLCVLQIGASQPW